MTAKHSLKESKLPPQAKRAALSQGGYRTRISTAHPQRPNFALHFLYKRGNNFGIFQVVFEVPANCLLDGGLIEIKPFLDSPPLVCLSRDFVSGEGQTRSVWDLGSQGLLLPWVELYSQLNATVLTLPSNGISTLETFPVFAFIIYGSVFKL